MVEVFKPEYKGEAVRIPADPTSEEITELIDFIHRDETVKKVRFVVENSALTLSWVSFPFPNRARSGDFLTVSGAGDVEAWTAEDFYENFSQPSS